MNPTKKRDAPSIARLPSPEPGDGDSSEDEEYVPCQPQLTPQPPLKRRWYSQQQMNLTLTHQIYQVMFKPCLIMHQVNMNQNQTMVQKVTLTVLHP